MNSVTNAQARGASNQNEGHGEASYTPGPLTVSVRDRWPFSIITRDADGNIVFSRDMPSNSTRQATAAEAIAGVGIPPEWKAVEHNARAIADEVLRAAAPDLLRELIASRSEIWRLLDAKGIQPKDARQWPEIVGAEAAIRKAIEGLQ